MTHLILKHVSKAYNAAYPAVADLSLEIKAGELMVLLGPSGSGKTTILRLIAGLLQPDAGDIQFNGRSVLKVPAERRGAVMMFQQDALFPFLTVYENVAFGLALQRLSHQELSSRVTKILSMVQLTGHERKRPSELSGGQRQRVALARALVVEPKILLLDEPLSQLDPNLRVELRQMIHRLQKELAITTVFVTHDQEEAISIADRLGLLINGRLHQIGTPEAFFASPTDSQVARFFGAKNFIKGIKSGQVVTTEIGEIKVKPTAVPDGHVLLSIRPEAIELRKKAENSYSFNLLEKKFLGQMIQYTVEKNNVKLTWHTTPFSVVHEEAPVNLCLPCERIIVFPDA
ncbi:MAG: ABC transporter ATP-binding protein [Chloroflexota bacterium]